MSSCLYQFALKRVSLTGNLFTIVTALSTLIMAGMAVSASTSNNGMNDPNASERAE